MALCLTRHLGQKVVVDTPDGRLVLTVLYLSPRLVRLDFKCPREWPIWRTELLPPSDVDSDWHEASRGGSGG